MYNWFILNNVPWPLASRNTFILSFKFPYAYLLTLWMNLNHFWLFIFFLYLYYIYIDYFIFFTEKYHFSFSIPKFNFYLSVTLYVVSWLNSFQLRKYWMRLRCFSPHTNSHALYFLIPALIVVPADAFTLGSRPWVVSGDHGDLDSASSAICYQEYWLCSL